MDDKLTESVETVLVVDDNPSVLAAVGGILKSAGFRVLSAHSGPDALRLAAATSGTIQLLLSDVDMPRMSGPALGEELKKIRPSMRVMLMSGGGIEGNLLVLNYGWAFIAKPFVATKLVEMVRNVIGSPDRSQPGGSEFDSRKDRR